MKRYLLLFIICLFGATSDFAVANSKKPKPARWFEVEVILFTRDIPHDSIREEFGHKVSPITYRRTRDLLTKFHYPDIKTLFYQLGGCSIEDQMHYELERKYNQLPNSEFLQREFAAQREQNPLLVEHLVEEEPQTTPEIDITWFYNDVFVPPDVTVQQETVKNTCGEQIDFSNWYKGLAYDIKPRHQDRSFDFHYDMYPRVIIPGERRSNPYVHLMSPANFKLREIYRTLRRQPDIRPILHTSWRQPGVSPGRSRATRLYAGYDFSERFDFQGNLKPPEDLLLNPAPQVAEQQTSLINNKSSVVDNIEKVLAMVEQGAAIDYRNHQVTLDEPQSNVVDPEQVREIDGLFRIYIDNFNYLHIDAEFNIRKEVEILPESTDSAFASLSASLDNTLLTQQPNQEQQSNQEITANTRLANYHFKQTRRVISKQLHYFDHPYMGMIVQIRRYGW